MRVLALDLGSVRIGVAASDATGTLASPVTTVRRTADRAQVHARLAAIVEEYEAELVLVGLPLSLDGGDGPAATAARAEIDELAEALAVPVEAVDERFTTVSAHQLLREGGHDGRARRERVDAAAATVMLQAWLDGAAREAQR